MRHPALSSFLASSSWAFGLLSTATKTPLITSCIGVTKIRASIITSAAAFQFARTTTRQAFSAPTPTSHFSKQQPLLKRFMSSSTPTTENDGSNNKSCVPCHSLDDSALLSRAQVQEYLNQHSLSSFWKIQEIATIDDNTNDSSSSCLALVKEFVAKNFQFAMNSIQAMGVIAEREQHHPDFHLTSYRHVKIVLYTHSLGGITQNDVALARLLEDEVDIVYSPKWLREHRQQELQQEQE